MAESMLNSRIHCQLALQPARTSKSVRATGHNGAEHDRVASAKCGARGHARHKRAPDRVLAGRQQSYLLARRVLASCTLSPGEKGDSGDRLRIASTASAAAQALTRMQPA